jgi:glycosyltransferase involved in cell wall biosynthesis
MKILALTSSYPRYEGDPTAPFIESITRHVAELGHSVHLVLPESAEWRRPSSDGNVTYHPYRYSPRRSWTPWGYSAALEDGVKIRRALFALAPIVAASAYGTTRRLLASERFDVVQAHWVIPNGPIAARAARRHDLPLVVSLHGSDVSVSEKSGLIAHVARRTFERARAVTAPSEDLLTRATRLGARGDLQLIPYGASVEAFRVGREDAARVRSELGLAPDAVVVAAIGRFVHWKGFGYLIDAVAQAARSVPELRLVFLGDGDLRDELVHLTKAHALEDRVVFAGMVGRNAMPANLAAADIVAVPSIHYDGYVDGLPNVALEAMASGKPLVATRVGGLPQLVRDGENGLLVEEKDAEALASAIVRLAHDPVLRLRLGTTAEEEIRSARNWDAVAAQFVDVYERAIAGP